MPERPRRVAAGALAAALAVAGLAPAAGATERVSGEELRALARRAASDPAAAGELREVRRVDGRPVDLGQALAGADGDAQRGRLRALAEPGAGAPSARADAGAARHDARHILDGRRYRPAATPRPLRGVLHRIGGWLRPVLEPVGRLWGHVVDNTAGRLALAAAVAGAAALASTGLVRRRNRAGVVRTGTARRRPPGEDPAALERRADAAERAGRLDLAFRLRFRAGLLRLDGAGALAYRPSLTTGEVVRRLGSPTFVPLAAAFDEIAYGGRPARPPDLDAARAGWPRVLEEVGGR
jgi:hypothetical protein